MSYFSQSKGERDMKIVKATETEPKFDAASGKTQDMVSTLGQGMLITGNIVCVGSVQIYGRVVGDIHASQLVICPGARVEGKVIAPETIIQGAFSGTIHGNSVKLQSTATVDGEIFNRSLTIEENAQFEGVARRLDKAVAPPSSSEVKAEETAPSLSPAPEAVA
jgi:cytoskeletal protein CcmA (bactofilin family)